MREEVRCQTNMPSFPRKTDANQYSRMRLESKHGQDEIGVEKAPATSQNHIDKAKALGRTIPKCQSNKWRRLFDSLP